MKHFLIFLLVGSTLMLFSHCKKSATEPDRTKSDTYSFTSANVKTNGAQYFNFATNNSTDGQSQYDLAFTTTERIAEVGSGNCVYFDISADPVIKAGPDVTIAKIEAASLDAVTTCPADTQFGTDDTTAIPLIGKSWLDQKYNVKPDVYVFKTCKGNYGLLAFQSYVFDMNTFHIVSIKWYFKYNANGSTDFSSTALDSFSTENAYEQKRYFSFTEGALSFGYGTWDVEVIGSAIWLGPHVTIRKLENTNINDVSSAPADHFNGDDLTSYVTSGWYDSDENHKVIPNDYVYAVKTQTGKVAAFKVTNYYDDHGNSGVFTINWKYLP